MDRPSVAFGIATRILAFLIDWPPHFGTGTSARCNGTRHDGVMKGAPRIVSGFNYRRGVLGHGSPPITIMAIRTISG